MTNLDVAITRGDVAKLIEAASKYLEAKAVLNPTDAQEIVYMDDAYRLQAKRADRMK